MCCWSSSCSRSALALSSLSSLNFSSACFWSLAERRLASRPCYIYSLWLVDSALAITILYILEALIAASVCLSR